jgi:general secretion pathway protein A
MVNRRTRRRLLLKKLGFAEDPFMSSADPRFLYLSTQHGMVLERMRDLIEDFAGLAVIDGSFGVGKSSLALRLENIYRGLPDEYRVIYIHTSSYESEFAGLQDLCDVVSLPRRKGLTKQWREFENFLVDEHKEGRNVVIILDDAQLLSSDALSIIHKLYNFDTGGRKRAQVILFGQREIKYKFSMHPEIESRVKEWHTLNTLPIEGTIELILFRCRVAGRERPFILTQNGLLNIHDATDGTPREIVNLCSYIIDVLGENDKDAADDGVVKEAIDNYESSKSSRPIYPTSMENPDE